MCLIGGHLADYCGEVYLSARIFEHAMDEMPFLIGLKVDIDNLRGTVFDVLVQ